MKRSIGGNRLGSGNKMNVYLHNYGRSTHNLSTVARTTAAPGVLYPIYTTIGLNGDTFNMDISTLVRTLPTQAPLFGSFKMQVDVFGAPLRLYNGVLHNNPLNVGMEMDKIYFPKIKLISTNRNYLPDTNNEKSIDISNSCLWKYLGLSGLGTPIPSGSTVQKQFFRTVNATPALAYFDIFKNYYANKQEDDFYQITPTGWDMTHFDNYYIRNNPQNSQIKKNINDDVDFLDFNTGTYFIPINNETGITKENYTNAINISFDTNVGTKTYTISEAIQAGIIKTTSIISINDWLGRFNDTGLTGLVARWSFQYKDIIQEILGNGITFNLINIDNNPDIVNKGIELEKIPLTQIDDLRNFLLGKTTIGEEVEIGTNQNFKFLYNISALTDNISKNYAPMNGLVTKTYQSDMFNNWVSTDWVDGVNGINEISKVATTTGGFTIDALNLAQKVYNMLNRIAVSGGTYQDWQEAVYSQKTIRHCETPIYYGSMSSEIVFEEIVSTASGENEDPLGTLAGKGIQSNIKGGKIKIKVEEPMIIMAIMSITPRIDYSQGNAWYLTELDSFNDLHKPALDAIGFQDLSGETMAWWCAGVQGTDGKRKRNVSYGKQPAWLLYMTDVNHLYGEFANNGGIDYMTLQRRYERKINNNYGGYIGDATTYIDPSQYNYAFAYSDRSAQNFWVQIGFDIKARRVMSAKVIPNL